MNYQEWEAEVPETIKADALWKMAVYRYSLFLCDLGWHDVTKLQQDRRTLEVSDQLYRSLGSISANIAEGYSRGTGKDRARFYEYALGSARESRNWYFVARHILGKTVTEHRLQLTTEIIRLLLTIVPHERGQMLREEEAAYIVHLPLDQLLQEIPLP